LVEKSYNILKHELVPEHTILSAEEKQELFKLHKIKVNNLPKMLTNEAVVKAIGAKEGDVIKIVRKSPTAGIAVYYRSVSKE